MPHPIILDLFSFHPPPRRIIFSNLPSEPLLPLLCAKFSCKVEWKRKLLGVSWDLTLYWC